MNKPKMQPILFSTPMVQAILRDMYPKTNTRRAIKPQPNWREIITEEELKTRAKDGIDRYSILTNTPTQEEAIKRSRIKPGDILWVRETWYLETHMCANIYVFRASSPDYPVDVGVGEHGWKPSIFMPKEAARIFLCVTEVRAERIQDITEYDAMREGFEAQLRFTKVGSGNIYNGSTTAKEEFMKYWDKLNSTRDGGIYAAEKNPWVFAYTFHRISKEEAYDAAS